MFYRDHLEMQYGGVIAWRARRDGFDLYLTFHRLLEFEGIGLVAFAALVVFRIEPLPRTTAPWNIRNMLVRPHSVSLAIHENYLVRVIFCGNF